ncbi:MAG TPA: FHA domain-containing protein, partial [Ktedonobacterales bacterium]|nr:FHA domain-containing protein [Ktedonobacterales bacterium]
MSTTVNPQPADMSSITFLTGPLAGQTFPITKPVTMMGRDATNDIVIKGDLQVSRRHARLSWSDGAWHIENVSQKNALSVDNQTVRHAVIHNQSVIALGPFTTFAFHTSPEKPVFLDELGTLMADLPDRQTIAASFASAPLPPPDPGTAQPEQVPALASAAPDPSFSMIPAASPSEASPQAGASASPSATLTAVALPAEAGQQDQTVELLPRVSQTLMAVPLLMGIPSLEVSSIALGGRRSYPLDKQSLSIGRDPANDIVIPDQNVSGQHLQIMQEGKQYILIHPHPRRQQTTNGLLYQGQKIRGNESFRKVLAPGDVFRIGDEEGALVTLTYHDGSGIQQEALPPIRPIKLDAHELTIGRHADNTVVLAHPQVSAHHAKLVREGGAYRILDLHSTNHIYVNAQPVTNHLLKLGDELRIGPYRLVYETTQLVQYDESQTIRLDALHLTKVHKKRTTLLNDISLSIPPRTFVAFVGASGAGKSTLLDALSGLRPVEQGRVLYNGQDYYRNLAAFNMQIGYVPQDDIVHRELTVERALFYAARLRLPGDFTPDQIEQRIAEVLEDVELTDQRRQPVKQLSGGQRKRVSLALELLANPSIFFLDEPTSGLDPGLDRKMMILLRKLADKGHTIMLVTHATNNINVCDYVCFLARGGRLAYFGPPEDAKTFFGKTDFAEIYSALEATSEHPDAPEEAERRFRASQEYQIYIEQPLKQAESKMETQPKPQPRRQARRGNPWKQLLVLTTRYLELLKNDPINLGILLLQAPVIALLLMWFTTQDIFTTTNGIDAPVRSPLFLMVVAAIWFGIINAVREIVKEAPIYRRERAMHLGVIPYVMSKVLVLGVLCLVQSLILLACIGWKGGYPAHGVMWPPFLELYISLALTALAGLMVGLALSALAPNADRAISLVPLIMLPEIIFSGTMFQLSGVLGTIADIMAARWGLSALGGTLHLKYFTFCAPLPHVPQSIGIPSTDCPVGTIEGSPAPDVANGFYPGDSQ